MRSLLKKVRTDGHGQLLFSSSGDGMGDESPPLHPTETEKRMVMANSHSLPWEGVEDESPPLHPTEKEKMMVMDQIAMASSLSPSWEWGKG